MKYFALILFFIMPRAFASHCEVYGISDSPQKLDCSFKNLKVNLRCVDGVYQLNGNRVSDAFHMEVEEGPVPLVFKSAGMQLTVMIESKKDILAELDRRGRLSQGTCL